MPGFAFGLKPRPPRPCAAAGLLLELREPFLLFLVEGLEVDDLRRDVRVRAARGQRPDDVGAAVRGREVKGALALHVLDRIHVGAVRDEELHRVGVAGLRRQHQRRRAVGRCGLRVSAPVQQRVDHRRFAVLARDEERRITADAGGRADVRAAVEQELRELDVVLLDRPVQRRHAVGLRRVHVVAFLEERADGVAVAAHRGLDDGRPTAGGRSGLKKRRKPERPNGADTRSGDQRFSQHAGSPNPSRRPWLRWERRCSGRARPCCRRNWSCRRGPACEASSASGWPSACRPAP